MYDPGDLQVFDPILSDFSVGFKDQDLYGEQLAPVTRVFTRNGRYRVFDRSDWLIWQRDHRAPGTVANEISGRKWSEDTFRVKEHSLQTPVYDEEEEELNSPGGLGNPNLGGAITIDPETDATRLVTRSLLLNHELAVATIFRNTANYTLSNTVTLTTGGTGTRWNNYALATAGDVNTAYSNPVADLRTAVRNVRKYTKRWPNVIAMPLDAVGVIENHPRVVARYQYTSVYDPNAWRQILGVPEGVAEGLKTIIYDSEYNTADNIDATPSMATFWGQDVWVGVVDETDDQNVQTFAKTFARPYPNGDIRPTDRWREEGRKTDVVRTSTRYDIKITSPGAGYLIKTAVDQVF